MAWPMLPASPMIERDVDDAARSAVEHVLQDRPGQVERAGQVDLDDPVPVLDGHLADGLVQGDAGVVDQDVEAAVGVEDLLDHPFAVFGGADVALVHAGAGVVGDELRRRPPCRASSPRRRSTPRAASRSLIARPMPRIPPVTRATWPVMSAMLRSPSRFSRVGSWRGVRDGHVQEQGLALAAAAAQAGRAEAAAAAAQLQGQVQRDPGARGADRVAHRDRAAVDVDVARRRSPGRASTAAPPPRTPR